MCVLKPVYLKCFKILQTCNDYNTTVDYSENWNVFFSSKVSRPKRNRVSFTLASNQKVLSVNLEYESVVKKQIILEFSNREVLKDFPKTLAQDTEAMISCQGAGTDELQQTTINSAAKHKRKHFSEIKQGEEN